MTKVQVNSQGKVYIANGKALLSSGGSATLITKSITQNGTYNASSDNADGYSSVTVNVSGGGEISLTRIKDDTNTEIGTYFCNFTDGNGNKYKVILLDAQYRNSNGIWCSNASTVTNLPLYSNLGSSNVLEARETATFNTQKILDYCTANGYTSDACTHCRSKSFMINGITYYGQLPNMIEVIELGRHYSQFDALDTSASSYSSLNFSSSHNIWSSSQYSSNNAWYLTTLGNTVYGGKTGGRHICPVLEIPY